MIPVCEPLLGGREAEYVLDCLKTNWISSRGKYVDAFEKEFAKYCGCKYGICTTSGTTALHLAMAALDLKPGDEVIVPAFTMIASAFAIIYVGAKPVLVDADPETWNMDATKVAAKVTSRTRAIMPVHIYGHPCDMDPILEVAKGHNLRVVEDAAEVHGARYKGRKAGSLGDMACFSFYANKIITTGEGGMVVTNDDKLATRAQLLKDLAFTPDRRYLHRELGFNFRMTNIQAAIGLAQLERADELVEMRRRNARLYNERLREVRGIGLPPEKEWAKNVYWMYSITVEDDYGLSRDDLMVELRKRGVDSRSFFIGMHRQPVFLDMGLFRGESYPVTDELARKGLYLPSSSGLTVEQIDQVCRAVKEIQAAAR